MTNDINCRRRRWKKKTKVLSLNLSEEVYTKLKETAKTEKKSMTKLLIEILSEKFGK